MMTYILACLFLDDQFETLSLADGDTTQVKKQKKKVEAYQKVGGIYLRAYWSKLSKIPLQVWRFFKNCFMKKSSSQLYQSQLKPILESYL